MEVLIHCDPSPQWNSSVPTQKGNNCMAGAWAGPQPHMEPGSGTPRKGATMGVFGPALESNSCGNHGDQLGLTTRSWNMLKQSDPAHCNMTLNILKQSDLTVSASDWIMRTEPSNWAAHNLLPAGKPKLHGLPGCWNKLRYVGLGEKINGMFDVFGN